VSSSFATIENARFDEGVEEIASLTARQKQEEQTTIEITKR
jgi:hypothetical protein